MSTNTINEYDLPDGRKIEFVVKSGHQMQSVRSEQIIVWLASNPGKWTAKDFSKQISMGIEQISGCYTKRSGSYEQWKYVHREAEMRETNGVYRWHYVYWYDDSIIDEKPFYNPQLLTSSGKRKRKRTPQSRTSQTTQPTVTVSNTNTETFAKVIYVNGGSLVLIDDTGRLIRGKYIEEEK